MQTWFYDKKYTVSIQTPIAKIQNDLIGSIKRLRKYRECTKSYIYDPS